MLERIKDLPDMFLYKGREGMFSWVLHRVTGIGIFVFLFAHIVEMTMLGYSPETFQKALDLYRSTPFRFMEFGLGCTVLFHALNGVRIILIDFWDELTKYHRQIFWIEMILYILILIPVGYLMFRPLFQ